MVTVNIGVLLEHLIVTPVLHHIWTITCRSAAVWMLLAGASITHLVSLMTGLLVLPNDKVKVFVVKVFICHPMHG